MSLKKLIHLGPKDGELSLFYPNLLNFNAPIPESWKKDRPLIMIKGVLLEVKVWGYQIAFVKEVSVYEDEDAPEIYI